jgi:hypothetical protein
MPRLVIIGTAASGMIGVAAVPGEWLPEDAASPGARLERIDVFFFSALAARAGR